jgi:tellurite resistance protein TehA-like permease
MNLVLNTALSCMTLSLASIRGIAPLPLFLMFIFEHSDKREGLYNILWALVFGFATLNILGLLARRFESGRNRLSFGEITAILVVGVAVLLLVWEMLYLFKVFPIKLNTH